MQLVISLGKENIAYRTTYDPRLKLYGAISKPNNAFGLSQIASYHSFHYSHIAASTNFRIFAIHLIYILNQKPIL